MKKFLCAISTTLTLEVHSEELDHEDADGGAKHQPKTTNSNLRWRAIQSKVRKSFK